MLGHYSFRFGNLKLNLHLPRLLGAGATLKRLGGRGRTLPLGFASKSQVDLSHMLKKPKGSFFWVFFFSRAEGWGGAMIGPRFLNDFAILVVFFENNGHRTLQTSFFGGVAFDWGSSECCHLLIHTVRVW